MIQVIRADARHFTDFGWLKTYWLFSFSEYYDSVNIQFGALRVFNDDVVAPHSGFGTHAHQERVFAGVAFVLHGRGTVADVSGFAAAQGVPVVLGAAAASVQCIGGLLVVGLLTPLAALGIGVTMVVAVVVMLVRAGEAFINPGGHS